MESKSREENNNYDFIIYFNSFLQFILDKKYSLQSSEKKEINFSLDTVVNYIISIKGNNFLLQTKFLNFYLEFNSKDVKEIKEIKKVNENSLLLKYEKLDKNHNLLIINYIEKKLDYKINENLLDEFEINEIIEDQKISLKFLNNFIDSISNLYILLLDGEDNKKKRKLIRESIKEKEGDKYLVVHSFHKRNKKKILKEFENKNKYRKNPIMNEKFEETKNENDICYYYIENNKEIVHFIFDEDNNKSLENLNLFYMIKSKIIADTEKKKIIFYDEYKKLFEKYLCLMFDNIKLNNDNNNIIQLESTNPIKKIISSDLIFFDNDKFKYSYITTRDKIKFYFETNTKVKTIKGNISQVDLFNLIKLDKVIFVQDELKDKSLFFTNKEMNDINDFYFKISHDKCIICSGPLKKTNNIKSEYGILYFDYDITKDLNPSRTMNFTDFFS